MEAASRERNGWAIGPRFDRLPYLLYEVARSVTIPIIGQGGIETTQDARILSCGASAISIGTEISPTRIPERIVGELAAYLEPQSPRQNCGQANVSFANPINTKETKLSLPEYGVFLLSRLLSNTSLLFGHEATASLPHRASSSNKIRHEIKNDHIQEGSLWLSLLSR